MSKATGVRTSGAQNALTEVLSEQAKRESQRAESADSGVSRFHRDAFMVGLNGTAMNDVTTSSEQAAALQYVPAPEGVDAPAAPQRVTPVSDPHDPRWVLALRVSESLDGEVLPPERRERLLKLGRVLGLTQFDAALVIACVQDQARRGVEPQMCPRAAEPQLRMIAKPGGHKNRSWGKVTVWLGLMLLIEYVVLFWMM